MRNFPILFPSLLLPTVAAFLVLASTPVPAAADDPEVLRAELLGMVDRLADLEPYLIVDSRAPAQLAALAEARAQVEAIEADELASLGDILSAYPSWWTLPESARVALQESGARRAERAAAAPSAANCSDDYDPCPACPDDGGGLDAVTGLKFPELIAEGVFDILNADIGYNIPNPAKIITGFVLFAFVVPRVAVEGDYNTNNACTDAWNSHLVGTNLDTTISSRASAKDIEQLQAAVDQLRIDDRRRAIEANMFAKTSIAALLTFVLPAADGGYIEEVAAIVRDTIDKQKASRYVTVLYRSDEYYDAAEVLRAQGRYREAYEQYRKAYRESVRS